MANKDFWKACFGWEYCFSDKQKQDNSSEEEIISIEIERPRSGPLTMAEHIKKATAERKTGSMSGGWSVKNPFVYWLAERADTPGTWTPVNIGHTMSFTRPL